MKKEYIYILIAILVGVVITKGLDKILYMLPAALLAITVHEAGHNFVARKFGNKKVKVTLNPFEINDIFGVLALVTIGIGWGRNVELKTENLKVRKEKLENVESIIGLAGPIANFITAIVLVAILGIFMKLGLINNNIILFQLFAYAISMNISIGVFNLLPIPPLDGYTIIKPFLSKNIKRFVDRNQVYIFIGLILMVYLLPTTIVSGLYNYATNIIQNIGYTIVGL